MDFKEIKELINLMNEHGLIEIEVEKEGTKIRLKKNSLQGMNPALIEEISRMEKQQTSNQVAGSQPDTTTKAKSTPIKSPMIGTFYRAPHPDAAAFVNVGDVIEPGQVICIIEAMKLMNEIKTEIKGKIVEVLVNSADPVEFGQPLFSVEPL